jgi:chaperone modulatory protein CbpM
MEMQKYIPIDIFCERHGVEISFINSLREFGLIEISLYNEMECIPISQILHAEKLVRLHNELAINMEGIDAISNLLDREHQMQTRIIELENRLLFYEDNL